MEGFISRIETSLFTIGYLDTLSYQDSSVHRLDPRAKLLVTLVFIATVVSFDKYSISALIPFFLYPVYLISAGNLPAGYILKKILIVSPFALMIALFNPIFDREIILSLGYINISGGWVSFLSIIIRFFLTVGSVIALIACTGFNSVCMAAERFGMPSIFAVQLLFLYRYLFVLAEEASRMLRARRLRSFGAKGKGVKSFGPLVGTLLLRTIGRAQRIHLAMSCRGFDGTMRIMKELNFGLRESIFTLLWVLFFIASRMFNLSQAAGTLILRYLP